MKNISKIFKTIFVLTFVLFVININADETEVLVDSWLSLWNCAASGSEATICKLKDDIEIGSVVIERPITIDLNTHTLTLITGSGELRLQTKTAGTVIITNGTIVNKSSDAKSIIEVTNSGNTDLQLKNVKMSIETEEGYGIVVNPNATATITVDKETSITSANRMAITNAGISTINVYGTLKANNTGSAIEGNYEATGKTDINIFEGANVSSTKGVGILEMSQGKVTINGGNVSGTSAIVTTKGDVDVKGGVLTGTGTHLAYVQSGNFKVNEDGSAVYIEPVAVLSVNVSGGTLESTHSAALSAPATDNKNDNLTISLSGGKFNSTNYDKPFEVVNKDDEQFVTGGEYSKEFDSKYIVGRNAKVKINDKIYIGKTAVEAAKNATKGTVVEVLQGDFSLEDVHNGIIVKNSGDGDVSLNGDKIAKDEEFTTPEEPEKEEEKPEEPIENPKTGVAMPIVSIMLLGVLGGCGYYILKKKTKNIEL